MLHGCALALTGRALDAVQIINSGISALRSTGLTLWMPFWLSCLAMAYAELGQFDDARRCIAEAITVIETAKERVWEAEVNRVAGEIARKSPERDEAKAEAYFERAQAAPRPRISRLSTPHPGGFRVKGRVATARFAGWPRPT
jgi:predicted ATPase